MVYADLLRDDERFPEAVEVLNRAIRQAPEADGGLVALLPARRGRGARGRLAGREADLKQALKLKPNEPEVLNYLGYAWADRGEHLKEALAMLEMAAALEPASGRHRRFARLGPLPAAPVPRAPSRPGARGRAGAGRSGGQQPPRRRLLARSAAQLEARYQWRRVLTLDPDAKMQAAAELKLRTGLRPRDRRRPAVPRPGRAAARDAQRGFAPAKVNLFLHVGAAAGRRLSSRVQPDGVRRRGRPADPRARPTIRTSSVDGPFAAGLAGDGRQPGGARPAGAAGRAGRAPSRRSG